MKKVLLIGHQFASLFKNNKILFLLFWVCSISSVLSFLYCYGNMIWYVQLRSTEDRMYREYTLSFVETEVDDIEEIIDKLNRVQCEEIEEISLCNTWDRRNVESVYASIDDACSWEAVSGRAEFTEEELASGSDVVILPDRETSLGVEEISIGGVNYRVIGIHTHYANFRIPLSNFIERGYELQYVKIYAKQVPNAQINEKIVERIKSEFPNDEIDSRYDLIESVKNDAMLEMVMISILFAISVLSFVYLQVYMVEKNYKEFLVYNIVGASKSTTAVSVMAEMLLLNMIAILSAIVLHVTLYDAVFCKLNTSPSVYYYMEDYMIIFLICMLWTLLINFPFMVSLYRNTISKMRRSHM